MNMDPLEFIMTPGKQFTVISEILHEVRRVYLDGRPHPKELEPTFDGHSVGHWDGDVMVVDTVGLRTNDDGTWLSDKAHIVEHIRMANSNAIVNDITISDPKALTGEWKFTRYYAREPKGTEINEYVCTNNRNLPDANGVQTAE